MQNFHWQHQNKANKQTNTTRPNFEKLKVKQIAPLSAPHNISPPCSNHPCHPCKVQMSFMSTSAFPCSGRPLRQESSLELASVLSCLPIFHACLYLSTSILFLAPESPGPMAHIDLYKTASTRSIGPTMPGLLCAGPRYAFSS